MSVEDRLRQVWGDGGEPPTDEGWRRIRARAEAAEAARRRRRVLGGGAVALAAAVAVITGIVVTGGDDPLPVETGPVATAPESTTSMPEAPPATTATTVPDPARPLWWGEHASPEDAATAFLRDVVGMAAPVVVGTREVGERQWEVDVVPRPDLTTLVTTVHVGHWAEWLAVTETRARNLVLHSPQARTRVASPVRLYGEALAFEGTVQVEVRGEDLVQVLGAGFVTGSGGGEPGPFEGAIDVDLPTGGGDGALLLMTYSAEDGALQEVTAVPVALADCGPFDDEPPGTDGRVVLVHFLCGEPADPSFGVAAVARRVDDSPGVLRSAIEAQVAGPSAAERATGLFSQFGEASADLVRDVTLAEGTAAVDFDGDLTRALAFASTSAGGMGLLEQLDATVFQFPTVDRVEYRLDGSCDAFFEWLQGTCEVRERP